MCLVVAIATLIASTACDRGTSLTVTNEMNRDVCVFLLSSAAKEGKRPDTEASVGCHRLRPGERSLIVMICSSHALNWVVLRSGNDDFFETKATCDQWRKAGSEVTVRADGTVDTGLSP